MKLSELHRANALNDELRAMVNAKRDFLSLGKAPRVDELVVHSGDPKRDGGRKIHFSRHQARELLEVVPTAIAARLDELIDAKKAELAALGVECE